MSTSQMSPVTSNAIEPGSRFATLQEWLAYQEQLHFTAMDLGLDRCREVAARMGLLAPAYKVVSISGTNGKGSCAAMLESIYRRMGYRVGAYTSPHLVNYNERISVDGVEVADGTLCRSFDRIDRLREDISLTYFEFGTLAAMDIFSSAKIDLAIMEVGLGGRLDAVNVLDADAALLTTIDIDHERWLGYDREAIGREKSGIFRNGRPAVCADPEPPSSVTSIARETGARLHRLNDDFHYAIAAETWDWRAGDQVYTALPKPCMYHDRQVQNAAGVLRVISLLNDRFPVSEEVIRACLRDFHLPGRFQIVPGEVPYILDVAHNRQAAETLVENLGRLPCAGDTHLVLGMLKDKNHLPVIEMLATVTDRWNLASLPGDRGANAARLSDVLAELRIGRAAVYPSPEAALRGAKAVARPGDRIVVTGSFLTVGAAMRCLR